ncbi:MAG: hypothetical protein ACE5JK_04995, partial [Candidatus Omnitrophota bacterium]
ASPLDLMQGILPILVNVLQTMNYRAEKAAKRAFKERGKAAAEEEGRIIIAIDDGLGSGWTQKKVQALRKTLSLLTRRNDKLGELTSRIEVRHGEGKRFAKELAKLVENEKALKENIMIITPEGNSEHFSAFDGISTITYINDDQMKTQHYYPLVEVVLYTLARAMMNKGIRGYTMDTVKDFYSFISNIADFDESMMYGLTVVIHLIPGAKPVTAGKQDYKDIAKFITTAA